MRKLILTTAAVAAIGLAGCSKNVVQQPISETIDTLSVKYYSTLTDERDGQVYRTVKISGQTWMTENLNYKIDSPFQGRCSKSNDTSYCKKYGKHYDWNEAMRACPNGYHLPSRQEWENLMLAAGGVRRIDRFDGSDVFYDFKMVIDGFTTGFLLSGCWTSTEFMDDLAYVLTLSMHIGYVGGIAYEKTTRISVRCVSDSP
jgi:uncharacterized protein (TIGR02145 family)